MILLSHFITHCLGMCGSGGETVGFHSAEDWQRSSTESSPEHVKCTGLRHRALTLPGKPRERGLTTLRLAALRVDVLQPGLCDSFGD